MCDGDTVKKWVSDLALSSKSYRDFFSEHDNAENPSGYWNALAKRADYNKVEDIYEFIDFMEKELKVII